MKQQYFLYAFLFVSVVPFSTHAVVEKKDRAATYGTASVSRLIAVHDGDTFKVDIADYPPIIGKAIDIRISGIDTPELMSKNPVVKAKAQEARAYLAKRLANVQSIVLKNLRRDKYFRILADVDADGVSVGDDLLKQGFALPYDGNKKPDWDTALGTKQSTSTTAQD